MKLFYSLFLSLYLYCHTQFLQENIYILPKIHKIPKIIHHIWVGKKPIPESYLYFMSTWKKIHPEWEHKLWTDKDVENFPWKNKALFLRSTNPGMKSDIWRYEILYNYGGVYVDTDMECIRSLNPIHERLEFYAGKDNMNDNFHVANSLIGAAPNSKILKSMIDYLLFKEKTIDIKKLSFDDIQYITGPGLITRHTKFLQKAPIRDLKIIFTNEYFQPVGTQNNGVPKTEKEFFDVEHCCFAIHHNGCSWIK